MAKQSKSKEIKPIPSELPETPGPSSTTPGRSETPEVQVDPLTFLQDGSYESRDTAEKGYDYQKELLIFFGLMGLAHNYDDFSLGYEVKEFPSFDDGVCKFVRKDGTYDVYCWQAKNYPTTNISNGTLEGVDKNFGLASYFPSIVEIFRKIRESDKKVKNIYFLFFTTAYAHETLEGVTEVKDLSIFKKICDFPPKSQRKCYRFTSDYIKNFQIRKGKALEENIKKCHENVEKADLANNFKLISEKLIYLLSTPNEEEFMELNMTILKDLKQVINMDKINNEFSFYNHFKKNLFESIQKVDDTDRPILNKKKFNELMLKSVIDADLPAISKVFLKTLEIKLPRRALATQKRNIFVKQGDSDLMKKLKTYLTSDSMEDVEDVIFVPLSNLNDLHLKAMKYSRWGVVVLGDKPTRISNKNLYLGPLQTTTKADLKKVKTIFQTIKTAYEDADRQASENSDINVKGVDQITKGIRKMKTKESSASN